jgi:hypothetical protein
MRPRGTEHIACVPRRSLMVASEATMSQTTLNTNQPTTIVIRTWMSCQI